MENQQKIDKAVMKRCTSYEQCCKEVNQAPLTLDSFSHLPEDERRSAFGEHKSKTWAKALNGKSEDGTPYHPNFNDGSRKWSGWWWCNDEEGDVPGSGFRFYDCDCVIDYANVGARHLFRTRELFMHAWKHGSDDFRDMIKG